MPAPLFYLSMKTKNKIYAVSTGPGDLSMLVPRAKEAIEESEVIAGYDKYIELIGELAAGKEIISSGMTQEIERCRAALDQALKGKTAAVLSSGDAGIYGMGGLLLEMINEAPEYADIELEIIPGLTAATSAASLLGAPLMNDFAVISLSNLLTPDELIRKKILALAAADIVTAIYNPRSKRRLELLDFLLDNYKKARGENCVCGFVREAFRKEQTVYIGTLQNLPVEEIEMNTIVFIGDSRTELVNGKMLTRRGYLNKYELGK